MRLLKGLLLGLATLVLLLIGIMFAIHNTQPVPLDFIVFSLPAFSVSFWLILSFFIGGVIGVSLSVLMLLRMKAKVLQLKRKLNQNNTELAKLKSAPQV
ncbi:lipopolysaccharide assembly protein LapA domain-containing protein [Pokkaliibacter sp. CJK22405]|uniref:lipopolysaccharide assembly protein LapA domain-containing protein n=1 Tax=Pokkaliibacter sp. CJK22405 TaxID=3384615 RepID=UPI00398552E0